MPRVNTAIGSPYDPWRTSVSAEGLHDPASGKTYFFDALQDERGRRLNKISIGRDSKCNIRLDHKLVSKVHAHLTRDEEDRMVIEDMHSTNGTYIDGLRLATPKVLRVGMRLRFGRVYLYAMDLRGLYPITAYTLEEFRGKAFHVYGNKTLAGESIGTSRATVRRSVEAEKEKSGK